MSKNIYDIWFEKEPKDYLVTVMFRKGFNDYKKICKIVGKFSRKVANALVGRTAIEKGYPFSLIPVLEETKNGHIHVHMTIGGKLKKGLYSEKVKSIIADLWKQQEGTISPSSHDPKGNGWFEVMYDPNGSAIRYMFKSINNSNPTDKLILEGLKHAQEFPR